MKNLLFLLGFLLCFNFIYNKIITPDELESLFKKALSDEMTEKENGTLYEIFEVLRRPEHVSRRSFARSTSWRATVDCIVCRFGFASVFDSISTGQSQEDISEKLIRYCIVLGIEKESVCKGFVDLNLPIVSYVITHTPEASPEMFCSLMMQDSYGPNNCYFEDPRMDWTVELPDPACDAPVANYNRRPLKIVVITDTHIDPLYEAYGVADCDEPTCCRIGQTSSSDPLTDPVDEEVVALSMTVDEQNNVNIDLSLVPEIRKMRSVSHTRRSEAASPAGYWGDYRNCDTPVWAFDDVIDTITENHDDIDLVYYIGDTIDHGVWETTYTLVEDMSDYLVEKMRRNFGDHVPIFPVLGNHDTQPSNQFAAPTLRDTNLNTTWLYDMLACKWRRYLTEESQDSFRIRGGYSQLVAPGLRVISINNNVAYKSNWWLIYNPLDAKTHLDFLVEELYKAERAGEKVHLLVHIPPGYGDLLYTWTREYNRIVNRFSKTITAEFNGHTHSDEFKVFYSPEGRPINVAWGGGSATSHTNYNLNYKVVTVDGCKYELNNILSYSYNLTEANLTPERRPRWELLYDIKNTFHLQDLSAKSVHDLVEHMVTDKKELFEVYADIRSKKSDVLMTSCEEECKLENLCRNVITVLWDRERCEEIKELYYYKSKK